MQQQLANRAKRGPHEEREQSKTDNIVSICAKSCTKHTGITKGAFHVSAKYWLSLMIDYFRGKNKKGNHAYERVIFFIRNAAAVIVRARRPYARTLANSHRLSLGSKFRN